MSETEQSSMTPKTDATKEKSQRCTVVPYPKVVFFYPLMCVAFVCGLLEATQTTPGAHSNAAGSIFIIVFLINVLVISFDFPGVKALALLLGIIVVVLGVLYLNSLLEKPIIPFIKDFAKLIHEKLGATSALYFLVSSILFVMIFGGILVNWLWNRWTIQPNRLLHKHGLLGELTEYPVIDLQLDKKIEDVFEYALLFAGTLTFRPNPNTPPIRLENVPRINHKEKKIQRIIRQLRVSNE